MGAAYLSWRLPPRHWPLHASFQKRNLETQTWVLWTEISGAHSLLSFWGIWGSFSSPCASVACLQKQRLNAVLALWSLAFIANSYKLWLRYNIRLWMTSSWGGGERSYDFQAQVVLWFWQWTGNDLKKLVSHFWNWGKYNPGDTLCLKSFIQPIVPLSFVEIWPQMDLLPASCHSHCSSVPHTGQMGAASLHTLLSSCDADAHEASQSLRRVLCAAAPKTIQWDHTQKLLYEQWCSF